MCAGGTDPSIGCTSGRPSVSGSSRGFNVLTARQSSIFYKLLQAALMLNAGVCCLPQAAVCAAVPKKDTCLCLTPVFPADCWPCHAGAHCCRQPIKRVQHIVWLCHVAAGAVPLSLPPHRLSACGAVHMPVPRCLLPTGTCCRRVQYALGSPDQHFNTRALVPQLMLTQWSAYASQRPLRSL